MEKIIASIDRLPPFPAVGLRALEMAGDPAAGMGDIVDVIRYDPAVTANCLRLCNSSYFGLREKVVSLQHAVVLLGTDTLVRIVLADCCRLSGFGRDQGGYALRPGELWRHSVACALISQILGRKLGIDALHELFTAALLHDIGKQVIDEFIADNFTAMFRLMQDEGYGMVAAEKAYFGIDHAELGGLIARAWQFPRPLIDAISTHHRLDPGGGKPALGPLTALGNVAAHLYGDDRAMCRHENIVCSIDPAVLEPFGISPDEMADIGSAAAGEMQRTLALFAPDGPDNNHG